MPGLRVLDERAFRVGAAVRLRDIKRRHDARTVRLARLMAMYSSRHEEWFVEDWAFEDIPCPYCFDDGMDPDCDYLLPCPLCGGCG